MWYKKNVYQLRDVCKLVDKGEYEEDYGIELESVYQREYKFSVKKESIIFRILVSTRFNSFYVEKFMKDMKRVKGD